MTARQSKFHALLRPHVPEVIVAANWWLSQQPIGFSIVIPFRPQAFGRPVIYGHPYSVSVMVTKGPDGLLYREHAPLFFARKGRTEPIWRPLR